MQESGLAPDAVSPRRTVRHLLARLEPDTVRRLLALRQAQTGQEGFQTMEQALDALMAEKACCRVNQLAVNGRDLMALGVPPGPAVGKLLAAALDQVLNENIPNERAALLGWLKENRTI